MSPHDLDESRDLDLATSAFLAVRRRLFGIAYRILGSAAEAEDIVQETWIRWQATDRTTVLDSPAFLSTITIRLALNLAQSAHSRRETYIGPWLPEPVDTSSDPYLGAERGEALSLAVLLLLEKLSPAERAAFVLREAFDYPYSTLAGLLETTEANVRQLVSRARRHVAEEGHTAASTPDPARQTELLQTFLRAAQKGSVAELEGLFAADVVSLTDGNGMVSAASKPVIGYQRVAKLVASFASHFWTGVTVDYIQANGNPGALLSRNGSVIAFASVETTPEGISQIMWVMSPPKLALLANSRTGTPQQSLPSSSPGA
ncbi:sigma-70 family RNA polymerase sigma factor [Edaphobacter sp. HDX4]|uniref:sigma-70 family RNA polymerase sigma factor n=1 Tax=Edaphobacter sp. HDX4 TaxID=2794064 RepID=UPI002FE6A436